MVEDNTNFPGVFFGQFPCPMNTNQSVVIPDDVKKAFDESDKYFPNQIQKFQYYDKYARFNYDLGRRETWIETVDRAVTYLRELSEEKLPQTDYDRIRTAILNMSASPSMRLLAMAGEAAKRQNIAIYNCSYLPIDSIDSLVEELIIAMAGCGVGFSVESQYVDKLPEVKLQIAYPNPGWSVTSMVIEDSTEGWADALREGLTHWFNGSDVLFDYSKIRPAGTPLRIKGGRASGAGPFQDLLTFTRKVILARQGKQLRPIDAHDIACKIGEAIVSGGVRRTALISLFDYDDKEMLECKNGDNIVGNEQRWMANNSAVWPKNITNEQITIQMREMRDGMRGEPGIFSRSNANSLKPTRRKEANYGTNPCGEINLRPYEFCNLSIAIARAEDTEETLREKVEIATIIGTIQSMATNFPGLRDIWKQNCQEERLLGVDINGQMDSLVAQDPSVMLLLREHAIATNKKYAEILGIPQSAAVTCVKPSGNSGVLFNCASGLHARWAPYYIRNVRVQAASPLRKVLEDAGVPMDPENGQLRETATTWVIHFPVKSPEGAVTRHDRSALEQCEYWLKSKLNWTEHNPSVTINYQPIEFDGLLQWVIDHKDVIGGMSFLPTHDAQYAQMPNEEISQVKYLLLAATFPDIDFSLLWAYEKEDYTTSSQELACVSGACSIEEYQALQAAQSAGLLTP
jgi:ribonucleoside-triphosphate reductase